jgi:acyl-CoA thioester hydrolase
MSESAPAAKTKTAAAAKKKSAAVRKRAPRKNTATAPEQAAEAATMRAEPEVVALFSIDFAVRWRDLDAFNHVNNSIFLTYLEEARLRWLESLDGPWLSETSAPVLASAELQFRRPIPWPETLRVTLHAERLGRSSLTLGHRLLSARQPDTLYCEGRTVMVWVDAESGRAAPLPQAVRQSIDPSFDG